MVECFILTMTLMFCMQLEDEKVEQVGLPASSGRAVSLVIPSESC